MITRRDLLPRLATLTGSVAFGVGTRHSDEDWLTGEVDATKIGASLKVKDLMQVYPDGFFSYREGNINLVIWFNKAFCDHWMEAHRHCVIERPKQRERRIKIFRHYLYGEHLA